MSRSKKHIIFVGFFFTLVTALFFLPVFTKKTIPLSLNLLVSFYSPWRNEGYKLPNKPIGFDNVRQMVPYKMFTKDTISKGSLPLWNPNLFAGSPHIAMLQPAFFYPGSLLDIFLPLSQSWTVMVIIQPIIAGICMYLFLRALKLSNRAALIGSISYAYCGWMIAWWEEFLIVVHSIIWLPVALHGILLISQNQKRLGYVVFTIALTLSVFAGFTQSTIYLLLTSISWGVYLAITNRKQNPLPTMAIGLITAIFLTAIQWIPTLETYVLSPRAVDDASYIFSGHLIPLTHLVTLFAPDYWGNPGTYNAFGNTGFYHERIIYLGLVPLILALISLFHAKNKGLTFWKYFTLITFSMVFAIPTSWIWYTLHVPIISAMQPTRIMMIASFGASVLAAYGFDTYVTAKNIRIILWPLAIIVLIAAAGWGWFAWAYTLGHHCPFVPHMLLAYCPAPRTAAMNLLTQYGSITFRNLLLPSATLCVLSVLLILCFRRRNILFFGLVCIHLGTMGYFANKYLYFSPASNMYPESPVITALKERIGTNRAWGYGNASVENNILSYFAIASPEGYAPFFPEQFGQLLGAIGKKGVINSSIARSDVTLKIADETELMTDNPYRMRLMTLMGVRFILETKNGERKSSHKPEERFPTPLFSLTWENKDWRLWEFTHALPRTFLASGYRVISNHSDYTKYLFDPKFDLSTTLLLDKVPKFPSGDATSTGTAIITSYKPNTVMVTTSSTSSAILFISDSYYPGWNAYIDNKQTAIYRADYAFRAVEVPKGNHMVLFKYEPLSWKIGIIGSVVGIILCAVFLKQKKHDV